MEQAVVVKRLRGGSGDPEEGSHQPAAPYPQHHLHDTHLAHEVGNDAVEGEPIIVAGLGEVNKV